MLLIGVLAPAVLLAVVTAYATRSRERIEVQQQAYRLVTVAATALRQITTRANDLFVALDRIPGVGRDDGACETQLRDILGSTDSFRNIGVVGADGALICSADPSVGRLSVADRQWFQAARTSGMLTIGAFERGALAAGPTVMMARRVSRSADAPVLFAALNLDQLSAFLQTIPLPDGSAINVVDRSGTILARYPEHRRWVGQQSNAPVITAALSARSGMHEATGVDGVNRLYGVQTVAMPDGTSITMMVGIPTNVAYGPANRRLFIDLAVLGALAFVTLAIAARTSVRLFTRKIENVVRAARRLSAGDLTARTGEAWTEDEIGELARTFDAMAWTLEQRTRDLQHAVESLRALAARLETVREEERTRISRELHDDMGQALTGVRMDLDRLKERVDRADLPQDQRSPIDAKLAAARKLVDSALDTARRVSRQLRPSVLDVLGLRAAIEWQLEELRTRTGLSAEAVTDADIPTLPEPIAVVLFRIVQESLTNVMRHAQATAVTVRLGAEGDQVVVEVMDNGRGFEAAASAGAMSSLGLLGMRERAAAVGGTCEIHSHPGEGTTVRATVPLRVPASEPTA